MLESGLMEFVIRKAIYIYVLEKKKKHLRKKKLMSLKKNTWLGDLCAKRMHQEEYPSHVGMPIPD